MSRYLKILTAVTVAVSVVFFAPFLNASRAQGGEQSTGAVKGAGKVLVVLVYDQNCKVWCTKVRPIIKDLADEFGERVHVEEIDNSPNSAEAAIKQVKDLGILALYKDIESVPVVLIFDVKRKKCTELNGPKQKEVYKAAIEKVIAKGQ